jgi:molecular chaperone IbpA
MPSGWYFNLTRLIGETNMTKLMPLFHDQFKDFDKFFVGFEPQMAQMQKMHDDLTKNIPNYPPYNIRKNDENSYTIELAVAGFGESEIDITIDGGKLIVKGNVDAATDALEDNFLFKGIATRAFTRAFAIDDTIEVKDALIFNGMLKIALERMIPEEKQPKKVPVKSSQGKQFLNEEA